MAVAVLVLQPLAGQRGAAGGAAQDEAAAAHVAGRPEQVADPLEAEHRVVDEERDHADAVAANASWPAAMNDDIEPASVIPSSRICPSFASR